MPYERCRRLRWARRRCCMSRATSRYAPAPFLSVCIPYLHVRDKSSGTVSALSLARWCVTFKVGTKHDGDKTEYNTASITIIEATGLKAAVSAFGIRGIRALLPRPYHNLLIPSPDTDERHSPTCQLMSHLSSAAHAWRRAPSALRCSRTIVVGAGHQLVLIQFVRPICDHQRHQGTTQCRGSALSLRPQPACILLGAARHVVRMNRTNI